MENTHMISKLEWEWERFMMDMTCTTKKNIFAKADEIVIKKFICRTLIKESHKLSEEEQRILCSHDSIIDSIYLHINSMDELSIPDLPEVLTAGNVLSIAAMEADEG